MRASRSCDGAPRTRPRWLSPQGLRSAPYATARMSTRLAPEAERGDVDDEMVACRAKVLNLKLSLSRARTTVLCMTPTGATIERSQVGFGAATWFAVRARRR